MSDNARFLPDAITFDHDRVRRSEGDIFVQRIPVVTGEFRFLDGAVSTFELELTAEERETVDAVLRSVKERALARIQAMKVA